MYKHIQGRKIMRMNSYKEKKSSIQISDKHINHPQETKYWKEAWTQYNIYQFKMKTKQANLEYDHFKVLFKNPEIKYMHVK